MEDENVIMTHATELLATTVGEVAGRPTFILTVRFDSDDLEAFNLSFSPPQAYRLMNDLNGHFRDMKVPELKSATRSQDSDVPAELTEVSSPAIGLDLDGCIDEAPHFFWVLSNMWPGKVFVVSYRSDRAKAEADLSKFGIRYDELILVNSLDAKAKVIAEKGILVFFDDQPETLKDLPPTVNVMLVRNGGNFDFVEKLWMFSERTGKLV